MNLQEVLYKQIARLFGETKLTKNETVEKDFLLNSGKTIVK